MYAEKYGLYLDVHAKMHFQIKILIDIYRNLPLLILSINTRCVWKYNLKILF
jgi:hypothetical protein